MKTFVFSVAVVLILFSSCKKSSSSGFSITTIGVADIGLLTASSGVFITNDGNIPLTEEGICYDSLPNPTIAKNKLSANTSSTGNLIFRIPITGLPATTTYHVRAYVIYNNNTIYGQDVTFVIPVDIGFSYQGGIIFEISNGSTGTHGLIAAPTDQSNSAEWGCNQTGIPGTNGTSLGQGQSNTTAAVNGCSQSNSAARICDNLILNGYSDWFLPARDELNLIYQNLRSKGLGNFVDRYYWSSSADGQATAWCQNFSYGYVSTPSKSQINCVRAVRAF